MADAKEKERTGYSIETYQRADGWWSFRINGQESRYRSSNEAGLQRTIDAILKGPPKGAAVRLKPVRAAAVALPPLEESKRAELRAKGFSDEQIDAARATLLVADPLPADHWSLKASAAERVAAFLAR